MKKPFFVSVLLLAGCASADMERIAGDAMSAALNGALNSATSTATASSSTAAPPSATPSSQPSGQPASNAIESNNITTDKAARTKRDLGKISVVKTEKNPSNQTKLVLESCSHPRIGGLRCGGYIFEVTSEGWLIDKPISFDDLNNPEIVVAAGNYYLKFTNPGSGYNRFTTGEFTIKPFVTNHVVLEME